MVRYQYACNRSARDVLTASPTHDNHPSPPFAPERHARDVTYQASYFSACNIEKLGMGLGTRLHAMYVAMFHYSFCKTLVWAIRVYLCSYPHDYMGQRLQICMSSSSKIVVSNGNFNSKSGFGALCLVLSWRVTYTSLFPPVVAIAMLVHLTNVYSSDIGSSDTGSPLVTCPDSIARTKESSEMHIQF